MTTSHAPLLVLSALLDLAKAGRRANAASLALRCRLGLAQVASALTHLEDRGLADARGCRLTLRGLAVGHALAAQAASHVESLARVA
jgi:hypothetical protein